MNGFETLQRWVDESKNIVFFGGAGVSTESGIPDFRSVDGLYHQRYPYPPEASPNAAHLYRGGRLALINKSPTPYDKRAGLVISAPIGKVLGAIQVR